VAARGFMRRREINRETGQLRLASSPFPFCTGDDVVTCKTTKNATTQSILSFLDMFLPLLDLLLSPSSYSKFAARGRPLC
jgi:hypothetical protein